MGSYTDGGLTVELSRPLREEEIERFKAAVTAMDEDTLGDSWYFDGPYGDVGEVSIYTGRYGDQGDSDTFISWSVSGKVYEIGQAVNAMLSVLPADVTANGVGTFETDGFHWALVVEGREAVEHEADVVVDPNAPPVGRKVWVVSHVNLSYGGRTDTPVAASVHGTLESARADLWETALEHGNFGMWEESRDEDELSSVISSDSGDYVELVCNDGECITQMFPTEVL